MLTTSLIEPNIEENSSLLLQHRSIELTKIIEAINELSKNKDWQLLKGLVFDGLVDRIEKSLQLEVKKNELQPTEIYRLQGQLLWAKRYSDLYKLAETYKLELNNINKRTKEINENATI